MSAHQPALQEYVQIDRRPSPTGTGRTTFVVTGEVDIGNVDRLVSAVTPAAEHGAHVVLDMSGLEFIDCSVIHALIELLSVVGPDGRLIIERPSHAVRRVLELVGADSLDRLVIVDR